MKPANAVGISLDIHPYVKGRLRALPRQDDSGGILLGVTENDVTHITGFKRIPCNALRQAAEAAGPTLAGFYRLHTSNAPTLQPEEEEIWRQSNAHGRTVFLLINGVNGTATEATVWALDDDGSPTTEKISLQNETPAPAAPAFRQYDVTRPAIPKWAPVAAAVALAALSGAGWYAYRASNPPPPPPTLAFDLEARDGELTALWEQSGASLPPPKSASLVIREGDNEHAMDLTRGYTPTGRVVIRPNARDVVLTLNVQYPGAPLLSKTAIYLGFAPKTAEAAEPVPVRRKRAGSKKTGPRRRPVSTVKPTIAN